MKYAPNPIPSSSEELLRYIGEELGKLKNVLNNPSDYYVGVRIISSATYDVANSDSVILADTTSNGITITLPKSVEGREINIKKTLGGNSVTIVTSGTELIDGHASVQINNLHDCLTFVACSCNEWWIV